MLALLIITFGILSRVVVHTPNFSPVYSLALFSGIYLKGRQAVWTPLALIVLSDVILGFYPDMLFVWASIIGISLIGIWLRDRKNFATVLSGSMVAAMFFFIVTNFGSWLALYPHTLAGLKLCYTLAIPFFRSTLLSTVAYSVVLYAAYEWLIKRSQNTALARFV